MTAKWIILFCTVLLVLFSPLIYLGVKIGARINCIQSSQKSLPDTNPQNTEKDGNDMATDVRSNQDTEIQSIDTSKKDSINVTSIVTEKYSANYDTLIKIINVPNDGIYEVKEGVKVIGTMAFMGCKMLRKVILPNTITEIKSAAFEKCSNLEEINLPDGLKSIGQFAFSDCRSLRILSLPKGLTFIGSNPFYGLDSIDIKISVGSNYKIDGSFLIDSKYKKIISYFGNEYEITIPPKITTIGEYSFAKNLNIAQLHLNNVEIIENFAFEYCWNIRIIEFGNNLRKIRLNPFKDIHFASIKTNKNFQYRKGLLIDNKSLTLIGYFKNDSVVDLMDLTLKPNEQIREIGSSAFYNCVFLRELIVNRQVRKINPSAFEGCVNLELIVTEENYDYIKIIVDKEYKNILKLRQK